MRFLRTRNDYRNAVRGAVGEEHRCRLFVLIRILYARIFYGIGPLYYSLFSLEKKPISGWSEYVLDREANVIERRLNSPSGRQLVKDKLRFHNRLVHSNFPTIPILAAITRPRTPIAEGAWAMISTIDDFEDFGNDLPDEIFLKTIDGAHGENAFAATRQEGKWVFGGRAGDASELFLHCLDILGDRGGWIIQSRIRSHASLYSLSPHALGTVRIVTALSRESVSVITAALKIPVGKNLTDNFSEGGSGNIVAPVELKSGRLGVGRMSKNLHWPEIVAIDRHPDTGYQISGFELPYWSETVALVIAGQRELKEAPTLGWDIALTDTGPLVVEANCGYGVEIHEVAEQKGLRPVLVKAWNAVGV